MHGQGCSGGRVGGTQMNIIVSKYEYEIIERHPIVDYMKYGFYELYAYQVIFMLYLLEMCPV